jgi:hypothetical protein
VHREQEAILAQLQGPHGHDLDCQARLEVLKDQDGNLSVAKASCLINELILRQSRGFRVRRQRKQEEAGQ